MAAFYPIGAHKATQSSRGRKKMHPYRWHLRDHNKNTGHILLLMTNFRSPKNNLLLLSGINNALILTQNMSTHIIIVEDDEDIAALVAYNLERQGWKCTPVHHGTKGWEQIRRQQPDCVILDLMLPGMDGMEIFREMKANPHTAGIPTLFLTARTELEERLAGLRLGADDYIGKPFSCKELVLRVRNILSRTNAGAARLIIQEGPLSLDQISLQASLDGHALELTTAEFKLLAYLMQRPGKVQERYELQRVILGYSDTTQTRALDTHIKRLRQKLGEYSWCIGTERGVGYYYTSEKAEN